MLLRSSKHFALIFHCRCHATSAFPSLDIFYSMQDRQETSSLSVASSPPLTPCGFSQDLPGFELFGLEQSRDTHLRSFVSFIDQTTYL